MTYTPMMQQYLEMKKNYPDTIIFYRLGDFYEMFFEDAIVASKELDLVLTGRNAGVGEKIPMCGVPYHACNTYLPKLVERGYKVAIVEQMEEASQGKIVKREVVKIVTPGTLIKDDVEASEQISICSIYDYQYGYSLVFVDISTGSCICVNVEHNLASLRASILKNNAKEVVVKNNFDTAVISGLKGFGVTISYCDNNQLDDMYKALYEGVDDVRIIESYSIMVNYLNQTQKRLVEHLQPLILDDAGQYLKLDYNSILNLELIKPLQNQGKNITLWSFLDKCKSSMGSRMLKTLIERPLVDIEDINKRLDQVTLLKENLILQDDLKDQLNKLYDLERLTGKIALGTSNPLDCVRLIKTLDVVPNIKEILKSYPEFEDLLAFDDCAKLHELLDRAIVENPPINFKDGGIFKHGYSEELDELTDLRQNGKNWLLAQEAIEKERTGIKSLKIGYNRVFGYYIEVSKGNIANIKEEYGYIRKQTLSNQERYITQELKDQEDRILQAQDKAIRKEIALYDEIVDNIKQYLFKLQKMAKSLAYIDCILAFSFISGNKGYSRPIFTNGDFEIIKGRHPILEDIMKQKYVANDCILSNEQPILLLTGPNMGGKSTYMRQVALTVIMAQIGVYVPCSSLKTPIFDAIFTRIGASDDILSGQSTFMVEMNEANYALGNATDKSLIIFDEIGRGTSTYDGLSLARAMIEYIATNIKAKTLFSTHYHELTSLENEFDAIWNYNVMVHEENDHITFMYKVKRGKANKSYGINVARLAKLPDSILNRASILLSGFESKQQVVMQPLDLTAPSVHVAKVHPAIEKIKMVNPDILTPLEALMFVNELKKEVEKDGNN